MPAQLNPKEKEKIVDHLFAVFRDYGYDGASLSVFSKATGLGKSSLYHHFPKGKEQMAEAVLEKGRTFIQGNIASAANTPEPLKTRVRNVVAALNELYSDGRSHCVLARLACAEIGSDGRRLVQEILGLWTNAIAKLASDSGMRQVQAQVFAEDWIAKLQGSLVIYAANGDLKPFQRNMDSLTALAK